MRAILITLAVCFAAPAIAGGLHPLKNAALPRRTPIADIGDQTEKRELVSCVAFNRIDLRRPWRTPIA